MASADRAMVYDNSRAAAPFKVVAEFFNAAVVGVADWPPWTPPELRSTATMVSRRPSSLARSPAGRIDRILGALAGTSELHLEHIRPMMDQYRLRWGHDRG